MSSQSLTDDCYMTLAVLKSPRAAGTNHESGQASIREALLRPSAFCFLISALCLLLSAFCLLPSAFAQEPAAPASQAAPPKAGPRSDPKSQELLNQVIQALGGQAFLNYKTMSSRGRFFSIYDGETMGFAPYVNDVNPPDKRRLAYGKNQSIILMNDGDRGWELDRYGLIRQKIENVRRWQTSMRYSLESVLRRVVREPGSLILDGGVDFVDLLPARVLEISDSRQVDVKVYLSRSNYLPIRIAYRVQNPETREWDEYAEAYSDYRPIQGIQTPMHVARYENGRRVLEYFLNEAEYNKEFPAGYFQPRR
jgi:hypothetical protein